MISKKSILANELIREIISIRVNTLWKMLALEQREELPDVNEEGATGKYDNKGAIFIPGGLIHQDVDESSIDYSPYVEKTPQAFRKHIRSALEYDNATLLYPDGIATGVNLDSGFFSKAARRINTFKKAAYRRNKKIGSKIPIEVSSEDIIRSHCPTYFKTPYGSRTRISTCVSIGLIEPAMYFAYCKAELNFSKDQAEIFSKKVDQVHDPVTTDDGIVLHSSHIVVCHDTRYKENSYTGLTRILGIGKFGEFSSFTLEKVSTKLLRELKRKKQEYSLDDVFADYCGNRILGILRIYAPTNAGRRSLNYKLHVVSPLNDCNLQVERLEAEARKQYRIPLRKKS